MLFPAFDNLCLGQFLLALLLMHFLQNTLHFTNTKYKANFLVGQEHTVVQDVPIRIVFITSSTWLSTNLSLTMGTNIQYSEKHFGDSPLKQRHIHFPWVCVHA